MSDIYRDIVIDHYKNPRNVGSIKDADVHGHDDNAVCGDTVDIFLCFNAHDKVSEVKWNGEGCALSQASASLLSEILVGKTRAEVAAVSDDEILAIIGTSLNPSRRKCATLSIASLKKGLT